MLIDQGGILFANIKHLILFLIMHRPVCSSWIHVPVCQLSVEVEEGMGSL